MAIAYGSITTTDFNEVSPGTLVISKPSGLAVDDYMIAYLVWDSNDTTAPTLPSGWTQLLHDSTGTPSAVAYKKADSSDTAASNFTFTLAGTVLASGGSIMRFSGVGFIATGTTTRVTSPTNAPSFAGGITPLFENSYIIMAYHSPLTHTVSTYAITTNNPSWTEIMDEQNVSPDLTMSLAYASRPETTATGNFSVATSSTHDDHNGVLFYISPKVDAVVTGSTGVVTLNGNAGTMSGSAPVTGSTGVITLNGNAGTFSNPSPDWTNTDKNSSNWTNQDKS